MLVVVRVAVSCVPRRALQFAFSLLTAAVLDFPVPRTRTDWPLNKRRVVSALHLPLSSWMVFISPKLPSGVAGLPLAIVYGCFLRQDF